MDKKGRIITEETAYARMARTCSQKECAPFDITRKLKRMELPEPVIDKIINRLKKRSFLMKNGLSVVISMINSILINGVRGKSHFF